VVVPAPTLPPLVVLRCSAPIEGALVCQQIVVAHRLFLVIDRDEQTK